MRKIEYENLSKVNKEFQNDFHARINDIFVNGQYILGKQVEEFENNFAAWHKVNYCVALNSGLDALTLGLNALNLPLQSEVIVAANSYLACVLSIIKANLKPVLVEPDLATYNIDVNKIEEAITPNTSAIMPVHLYGRLCDMKRINQLAKKYNLRIIEDCAQAHGAKQDKILGGTTSDVGAFSFYPTKNLGAMGDAGCIITNDEKIAAQVRSMRHYGFGRTRYVADCIGCNSRMDEVQAAFLNIKLSALSKINAHKKKLAHVYDSLIDNSKFVKPLHEEEYDHIYHIYNIRHKRRDELKNYLEEKGIMTLVHYPIPPHKQPALRDLFQNQDYPISNEISQTTLSLPISYIHTEEEIKRVSDVLNLF